MKNIVSNFQRRPRTIRKAKDDGIKELRKETEKNDFDKTSESPTIDNDILEKLWKNKRKKDLSNCYGDHARL